MAQSRWRTILLGLCAVFTLTAVLTPTGLFSDVPVVAVFAFILTAIAIAGVAAWKVAMEQVEADSL